MRLAACLIALMLIAGCGETVHGASGARILLLGDSLMATHRAGGRAVANGIETTLDEEVIDRSVAGARYYYILPISGSAGLKLRQQYVPGNWDWVVLNGGGNDLLFGCGCGACTRQLDRLIADDGRRGTIPGFVSRLRQGGARVIYVGYLRTPGRNSPIEACRDEGDTLDARLTNLAALDAGVYFLPLGDLVPPGDLSYHMWDRIHPSTKASAEIGARIAAIIARAEASAGAD